MSKRMLLSDYTIAEILEKIVKKQSNQEKMEEFRFLNKPALYEFFELVYNPNITFSFKLDKYSTKDSRKNNHYSTLKTKLKVIRALADDGAYRRMDTDAKLRIANDLLDSLDEVEAKLLFNLFKKKFEYKGINKIVLKNVYPELSKYIVP